MAETRRMKIADLDEDRLSKVQALERDLGVCVLALEHRIALRDLSPQQLERLRAAEEALGVVLMAYECV
ncbi:MAG: hypothetical protein PVH41_11780 [Anaerolineae bacterium]|jgi:hypothetical protein